jgi:flagellar export protein FliJ
MSKRFHQSLKTLSKLENEAIDTIRLQIAEIDSLIEGCIEGINNLETALAVEERLGTTEIEIGSTLDAFRALTKEKIIKLQKQLNTLEKEREEQLNILREHFTQQKAYEKLDETLELKKKQAQNKAEQHALDEIGSRGSKKD